jgi:hypothetical protein
MPQLNYVLEPNDGPVRTQITLTKKLKELVENQASLRNQSLSEYLRQATILKLYLDQQDKQDLTLLANNLVGSLKLADHPQWKNKTKVKQWNRKIRQEWA